MGSGGKKRLSLVLHFTGLLMLAVFASWLIKFLHMPAWLDTFLIFVFTKIFADIIVVCTRTQKNKYIFFEDYLRDLFLYCAVAVICTLAIITVQQYLHGLIWVPILAAVVAMMWR